MITKLLLFSFTVFCSSAFAQESTQSTSPKNSISETPLPLAPKLKLDSSYTMRGASFVEGPDEAQFVQLFVSPHLTFELHPFWSLKAGATLSLASSRVQTRFNDPTLNSINPTEILLSFNPNSKTDISIGAINQDHLDAPALVQSGLAFLGAKAKYTFDFKKLDLGFKTQYTIPSSTSLESDRTGAEDIPSFITAGVNTKWKPRNWINTKAQIDYFAYSDLPSIVAYNSGRMGNEVIGVNQSESFFAYDFSGLSQLYHVDFDLNKKISPFLTIRSVDNFDAPSDRSRAQSIAIGSTINFKDFSIRPSLAFFYAESDASPAVYTAPRFGRNNREGEIYGLSVDFKKLGFKLDLTYVNSDLIQTRPVQNDLEYLEMQVEVANVRF